MCKINNQFIFFCKKKKKKRKKKKFKIKVDEYVMLKPPKINV